jgi:transposase-like protein
MKYAKELEALGIVLPKGGSGKTKCPQCHHTHKASKRHATDLSVDAEKGVYKCHRCGWQGSVKSRPAKKDAKTDRLHAYFHGRGISDEIYQKMGIRQNGVNIYMPYNQDGIEVNKKERPFDKKMFFQKKGGPNVLYNYDGIRDKKIIYIVEGEMDVLSFMQVGFYSVCSPNQGAQNKKDKNPAKKLESIHNAYDILLNADFLILGADNDDNGQMMNEYIMKLFGRDKCRVIDWQDSKDANEVLTKHGPEKLRKLISNADYSYTADERRLLDYFEKNEMHHDKVLPPKDEIITIHDSRIASNGNITTIAGQSKSGKSSVASAIIAGTISDSHEVDTLGMSVAHNSEGKGVLYFDTEQDPSDLYHGNFMSGMLKRAGVKQEPEWLHVVSMRSLSMEDRHKLLKLSMERYEKIHNGLHMVMLDGGSDFIQSIIDDQEAAAFVRLLMYCAEKYDTAIITLLHFNPADGGMLKARGHLGGELERKSEAVMSITTEVETNLKIIEPYRNLIRKGTPFAPIKFEWSNERGMMIFKSYADSAGMNGLYREQARKILSKVFKSKDEALRFTDLINRICVQKNVHERTAARNIKKYTKLGVIQKVNDLYYLEDADFYTSKNRDDIPF